MVHNRLNGHTPLSKCHVFLIHHLLCYHSYIKHYQRKDIMLFKAYAHNATRAWYAYSSWECASDHLVPCLRCWAVMLVKLFWNNNWIAPTVYDFVKWSNYLNRVSVWCNTVLSKVWMLLNRYISDGINKTTLALDRIGVGLPSVASVQYVNGVLLEVQRNRESLKTGKKMDKMNHRRAKISQKVKSWKQFHSFVLFWFFDVSTLYLLTVWFIVSFFHICVSVRRVAPGQYMCSGWSIPFQPAHSALCERSNGTPLSYTRLLFLLRAFSSVLSWKGAINKGSLRPMGLFSPPPPHKVFEVQENKMEEVEWHLKIETGCAWEHVTPIIPKMQ